MKRKAQHSQHFLRNPRFVLKLLKKTTIGPEDYVIDIGAGSGVIASQLALVARRVTAIEYDAQTCSTLRTNMKPFGNVTVVNGNFLATPLPKGSYKVFANIPFHLSSEIVQRLFFGHNMPENCYLIVQRQFAQKMIQNKRFNGMLGVQLFPWVEAKILYRLEKTDYWPHPNVDTVLLSLRPKSPELIPRRQMSAFHKFIEMSYSTPLFFSKQVLPFLEDQSLKPSQLSQKEWVRVYKEKHG